MNNFVRARGRRLPCPGGAAAMHAAEYRVRFLLTGEFFLPLLTRSFCHDILHLEVYDLLKNVFSEIL